MDKKDLNTLRKTILDELTLLLEDRRKVCKRMEAAIASLKILKKEIEKSIDF